MIYLFNEKFNLHSRYDRYYLHKIVDDMYHLVIANDGEQDFILREDIDVDELDCNHNLTSFDFDIDEDVTVEDLNEEKAKLHELISSKDKKGLASIYTELPFNFKLEHKATMKQLLESGRLEDIVSTYVKDNYNGFHVEHSRSVVASNSFYIKDEDGNVVIKISDHNTIFQQVEHGNNAFINPVGEFGVEMKLKEVLESIDHHLKKLKEEK